MKVITKKTLDNRVLINCYAAIGGTPHLFEYSKDDLKNGLLTGDWEGSGFTLDAYTMYALVECLRIMGFDLRSIESDRQKQNLIIPKK